MSSPRLDALASLLRTFSLYPNLYVLGAGASVPVKPTTAQLRDFVYSLWVRAGGYPVLDGGANDAFARVFGKVGDYSDQRMQLYLTLLQTNPNALDWYVSRALSLEPTVPYPANYRLFHLLPSGSTILTLNLDQYASLLRPYHAVLEPHGTVPTNLQRLFSVEEIHAFARLALPTPWVTTVVLLRPEPAELINSCQYEFLVRNWHAIRNVVIVGYSFARFRDSIDDYYTFRFLCEMTRHHGNPVTVVDPNPRDTSVLLEAELRRPISVAPFKWNRLCSVLCTSMATIPVPRWAALCPSILRLYDDANRDDA